MQTVQIGKYEVGPEQRPFLIAEAGINHQGDRDTAVRMVWAARDAGADAFKLQTFTADGIMVRRAPSAKHLAAAATAKASAADTAAAAATAPAKHEDDVYNLVSSLALSKQDHQVIADTCREAGLVFLSTPLCLDSVDLLEDLYVPAYKIASMDVTYTDLLQRVAATGKPVILSTGMADLAEVSGAVSALRSAGASDIVLLHCTSLYPPAMTDLNLRAMPTMGQALGCLYGYSDHTIGLTAPIAAATLGACVVEKHFTLDCNMDGPDQAISADPAMLAQLSQSLRDVHNATGNGVKEPTHAERDARQTFRRSLVTKVALPQGHRLAAEDLTAKRPGSGISPADAPHVVGRTLSRDVAANAVLNWDDL